MFNLQNGVPKRLLFDQEVLKLPSNFRKMRINFLFLTILYSGMNLLSFLLEIGKNQVAYGEETGKVWHSYLGVILIGIFFVKGAIQQTARVWKNNIEVNNDEKLTTMNNSVCIKLLAKLQGKVFKVNTKINVLEAMSENDFLDSLRTYISTLWRYQTYFVSWIAEILILLFLLIGFAKVSLSGMLIFTICAITYFIFIIAKKRIDFYKSQRPINKEIDQSKNNFINDILNIRPLNKKHQNLMVSRIVKVFERQFNQIKFQNKKYNKYSFLESSLIVIAVSTIIIVECIGATIGLAWVLDIISILTIFNTIINYISDVVSRIEKMATAIKDIETYYPDVSLIMEEFDKLDTIPTKGHPAKVKSITIPKSSISYKPLGNEIPYSLTIPYEFTFVPGDVVFLTGPTGCGKTTLLKAIAGRMKFEKFSIQYEILVDGDIENESFETNARMGIGSLLEELVFDVDNFDEAKLLYLFDHLHITEFLQQKNSDIISFLRTAKFNMFSNGQQQRLLLARNLYHISDSALTISLDEVTTGLNDEICKEVLEFIKEYFKDRILFISSHQKALTESICNKKIIYHEDSNAYTAELIE